MNHNSLSLSARRPVASLHDKEGKLLHAPATLLGKLLESKSDQQNRLEIGRIAKEKGLAARAVEVEEAVKTRILAADIAADFAHDQAVSEHRDLVTHVKEQTDERNVRTILSVFESKQDQLERLAAIDCDADVRELALRICDQMFVSAAQRILDRNEDPE